MDNVTLKPPSFDTIRPNSLLALETEHNQPIDRNLRQRSGNYGSKPTHCFYW
ncbi:MAG: hypothetical protein R3F50_19155 [Gammaproteobacteria bacterium]